MQSQDQELERRRSLGTIELYSHGLKVTAKDPRVAVACRRALNGWCTHVPVKTKNERGEIVVHNELQHMYGAYIQETGEFWFHKGQIRDLQLELRTFELQFDDLIFVKVETYDPRPMKLKLREGRVLRDYQEEAKQFALEQLAETDFFSKLIAMPVGTGKSHPDDTLVHTPSGWKEIGELIVGDQIFAQDGSVSNVTGVYPQSDLQYTYTLTLSDRRQIRASADHLWTVHSWDWRSNGSPGAWKTLTTEQVKRYVDTKPNKVSLPLIVHPTIPDVDLPLDPYLLGALIGDGHWTTMERIGFCKPDPHFVQTFKEVLPTGVEIIGEDGTHWRFKRAPGHKVNPLGVIINDLGLIGTKSDTKFIPDVFMRGSFQQKLSLLQGLFDTDGHPGEGSPSFSTTSERLQEQVVDLLRSIGAQVKVSSKFPEYTHNGVRKVGKKAWLLSVRYNRPDDLFRLARKRDNASMSTKYRDRLMLRVEDVSLTDACPSTCISIDHPSKLFVAEGYIASHNTVTLCGTAAENGQRLVVGVLPRYGKKWCADIVANLDLKPKDVMLIEKTNQLRGVIDVCKTQGVKKLPPVLIITLTTMRSFLEKYEESPSACVQDMGCTPTELWKILDCGIFAIDEAHEHLHTVFKTSMYLHGPKFLALSGTMRTEDDFQEKVQNTIFPRIKRFLKVKMEKYIDVEFISYSFWRDILPKIRYQVFGRSDYSHTTMEGSIMKRPEVLRDYIQMVDELLQWGYCRVKQKGEKAGIYVATVEMANKFVMYLTLRHPELNIIRYCAGEGDSYDELMKCDVYVSTIQSAGTALDIPNLTDVICTTMVNSSKSNIQVLGRLRKLPNDRKVTMYMPFCRQIQKHVKYTQFRAEIFRDITKSIRTFNFDRFLGRS